MTCWILGYLLVGFVISWIATRSGLVSNQDWRWELSGVILWPLSVILGVLSAIIERSCAEENSK